MRTIRWGSFIASVLLLSAFCYAANAETVKSNALGIGGVGFSTEARPLEAAAADKKDWVEGKCNKCTYSTGKFQNYGADPSIHDKECPKKGCGGYVKYRRCSPPG